MTTCLQKLPAAERQRLQERLEELDKLRATFDGLLVIPEVVTIEDVMNIVLDTVKGPQKVGDVCSLEEAREILRVVGDSPGADPTLLAHYVLDDYRKTHPRQ